MPAFVRNPLTPLARHLAIAGLMGTALVAPSQATTFTEVGDAGRTVATAQNTNVAPGALTDIFGSLASTANVIDVDLFAINIVDPVRFSATTVNAIGGSLDTELFLLTATGAPVYLNDDDVGGTSFLSTLLSGSVLGPISAGSYILGVSLGGYEPINTAGQFLFSSTLLNSLRGPVSGLQPAALGGFYDNTFGPASGRYDIQLTGVGPAVAAAVPEPSTTALLLLGGALVGASARGRRRGAASSLTPAA